MKHTKYLFLLVVLLNSCIKESLPPEPKLITDVNGVVTKQPYIWKAKLHDGPSYSHTRIKATANTENIVVGSGSTVYEANVVHNLYGIDVTSGDLIWGLPITSDYIMDGLVVNNILVFDDCDSVLFDEVCLNMLKATLDSGKKRTITWKSESQALRREGIPDRFEFKGGCIFITNVDFENVRSKKIKDHLAALMSRCHYLDLTMNSKRDKFLRINQIVEDGMLDEYKFGKDGDKEVIDFMTENQNILREISLRMVLKIADLRKMDSENWKSLAKTTCMSGAI